MNKDYINYCQIVKRFSKKNIINIKKILFHLYVHLLHKRNC